MSLQTPIRKIVIVGGGVTGWVAAAGIANSLRDQAVSIVLLDIPTGDADACPQSTIPQTLAFHDHLGLDERDVLRAANGTFRLGTEFCDWLRPGHKQLRPFGAAGANIGFIPFHHFATKLRRADANVDLNDYSISAAAARLGRFSHPDDKPGSLLSRLAYGLNLDATGYAGLLQNYAENLGVSALQGEAGEVTLHSESGFIEAVVLADGRRIEGDFFIDCSGERGWLIEGALQTGYEDWSRWLPCDRAVAISTEAGGDISLVVRCSANDAGWILQTPLQNRISSQYLYSSEHLESGQALDTLCAKLGSDDCVDAQHYRVRNGHRRKFWNRNCVALGSAAGAFESLEMTSLHLVQSGLTRLLGMLPDASIPASATDEYNRVTAATYENIRDYLVFNYVAVSGHRSPFWQARRSAEMPERLRSRLHLFESHGRVCNFAHETFSLDNWVTLFTSGGYWPQHYNPLLDMVDADTATQHFNKMRNAISEAAQLPLHRAYIDEFGRSTTALG